jgi:hypothetical protein
MGRIILLILGYAVSFALGALGLGMVLFGMGCGAHDPIELLMHLIVPGIPGLFLIFMSVLMWRFLVMPQHQDEPDHPNDLQQSEIQDNPDQNRRDK